MFNHLLILFQAILWQMKNNRLNSNVLANHSKPQ